MEIEPGNTQRKDESLSCLLLMSPARHPIPKNGQYALRRTCIGTTKIPEKRTASLRLLSSFCSRVMSGHPEIRRKLEAARDENGTTFEEAAALAGYPDALSKLAGAVVKNKYSSFVELHIEQGPELETEGDCASSKLSPKARCALLFHWRLLYSFRVFASVFFSFCLTFVILIVDCWVPCLVFF
jgi:hypothetical protein